MLKRNVGYRNVNDRCYCMGSNQVADIWEAPSSRMQVTNGQLFPTLSAIFIHSPPDSSFTVCQALGRTTLELLRTNIKLLENLSNFCLWKEQPGQGDSPRTGPIPNLPVCWSTSLNLHPKACGFCSLCFFTLTLTVRHLGSYKSPFKNFIASESIWDCR